MSTDVTVAELGGEPANVLVSEIFVCVCVICVCVCECVCVWR
jgi:hypothetical protein